MSHKELIKSKIKVLAGLVPGEGPLPSLQTAAFLLCPHRAERGGELSQVSSHKGTNPITRA